MITKSFNVPYSAMHSSATIASQHTSLSYFHKILSHDIIERLNTTSNLTLFLPVNEAWDALDPYERLYLESEFAADDLIRILDIHSVVRDSVAWSDSFTPTLNRMHIIFLLIRRF